MVKVNSGVAENDPYKNLQQDIKQSITPVDLRRAEEAKTESTNSTLATETDLRGSEQNPIRVNTTKIQDANSKSKNKTWKQRLKKSGPLGLLLAMLISGGGLMFSAQALMPFTIVNRLVQDFNSQKISADKRATAILFSQVDPNRNKPLTKNTIFDNEKWTISSKMQSKLEAKGINTLKDTTGKIVGLSYLKNGALTAVNLSGSPPTGFNNNNTISLSDALNDSNFMTAYDGASRTWRGQVAGWYDSMSSRVLSKLRVSRNTFANWSDSGNKSQNAANLKTTTQNAITGKSNSTSTLTNADSEGGTANGNAQDTIKTTDTKSEVVEKLKKSSGVGKTGNRIAAVANGYCTVKTITQGIQALAYAMSALNLYIFASNFLEAVQKNQAGQGNTSPLNEYATILTTPYESQKTTTTAVQSNAIAALMGGPQIDNNDASILSFNISGLGLTGGIVASLLGFTSDITKPISTEQCLDAQIAVGVLSLIASVGSILTGGLIGFAIIGAVSVIGGEIIDTAINQATEFAATAITRDFTEVFGEDYGNALVKGSSSLMAKNHQASGGSPGNDAMLALFHQEQQSILAYESQQERNTLSPFDISSQNTFLGSIIYRFSTLSNSLISRSALSSILSFKSILSNSTSQLLPTSSALGETSFIRSYGHCPELEAIGARGDAFCNPYYITDLTTIEADPADVLLETYKGVAVRDYLGGGVSIAPLLQWPENNTCLHHDSTSGYSYYSWFESTNFETTNEITNNCYRAIKTDSAGNPIIKKTIDKYTYDTLVTHSSEGGVSYSIETRQTDTTQPNLSKYIAYCTTRDTEFGTVDASILNSEANITDYGFINSVPIVGDLASIFSSSKTQSLLRDPVKKAWATGAACVAGNTSGISWNEVKWYQRYTEDQRLIETQGLINKSSITAFLDEFYKENPLDTSNIGTIARFAGMSTDEVSAYLEFFEYQTFLADYHPANLAPLTTENTQETISFTQPQTFNQIYASTQTTNPYNQLEQRRQEFIS